MEALKILKNHFKNLNIYQKENVIYLGDSNLQVKILDNGKYLVTDGHFPRARRETIEDIIIFLNTCHRYY